MPTENRIKDTQNMSLHLHNPYIVSMQGSLKTGPVFTMPNFPVICGGGSCGGKNGVHEPGQQPDVAPKPGEEPKQMDAGIKPGAGPEAASEPVKGAAPKWEKVVENGRVIWVDHTRKMISYTKPEDWSENEADTEAAQIAEAQATQNAESQDTQNAESQELSRFKHCTAFYLPVEFNFLEYYLNMTRYKSFGWMLSLIMLGMANFFNKKLDDANEERVSQTETLDDGKHAGAKSMQGAGQEQVSKTTHRIKTLVDFITEKSLQENVLFKLEKEMEKLQSHQVLNKLQQILDKYNSDPRNTSAQSEISSSASESESAELNDDVSESWTYKCNTQSFAVWYAQFRSYNAVHVTFTDKDSRKENFYLFTKRDNDTDQRSSSAKTNQKYLFVYDGQIQELSSAMQNIAKVDRPKRDLLTTLIKKMDYMYEETKPGADGISYYECLYATDAGYWHDSARQILMQYGHTRADLREAMDKFVRAIAKYPFDIESTPHKEFRYNYEAGTHHFEHDDDWHVIIRLDQGKPLIFFCAKDQQPQNCIPCTRERALGSKHATSPYTVKASDPSKRALVQKSPANPHQAHDREVAASAAKQRIEADKNRGRVRSTKGETEFSRRKTQLPPRAGRSLSPGGVQRELDQAMAQARDRVRSPSPLSLV